MSNYEEGFNLLNEKFGNGKDSYYTGKSFTIWTLRIK